MMNELYQGIKNKESFTQRYFGISSKFFLTALIIIIIVGIYIGTLLFGDNSWRVLMDLNIYSNNLQKEIRILKADNAQEQKVYFQLKEISA